MNDDLDKAGFNRLWSGTGRDKGRRESDRQPEPFPTSDMPLFDHDRAYRAFELRDNARRMHIQCASPPSRFPPYTHLLDILYDHDYDSIFTLHYSFNTIVEVTGRNLWPIVHAISFEQCSHIREYHKKLYDPPANHKDPFIESIKITAAALPTGEKKERKEAVDFSAEVG